jgi:hypothetical protein
MNRYCWIEYFQDAVIVRVRAYLDSAMVARWFEENPDKRACDRHDQSESETETAL